jgi:hypothetical protein
MNGFWQSMLVAVALAAVLVGLRGNVVLADDKVTYPSPYETPQDFEDGCESAGGDVIDGYDSEGYLSWSSCQIDGDTVETCEFDWDGDTCTAGGEMTAGGDEHDPVPTGAVRGTVRTNATPVTSTPIVSTGKRDR